MHCTQHFIETRISHLKHSTANPQNGSNTNQFGLLLRLSHQEHHIEQVRVQNEGLFTVQEHTREVLGQLIVVLKLVTYRVE